MAIHESEGTFARRLSRRQFLKTSAVAGLGGMILAACGSGGGTGSAPAAPAATSAPAAPAATTAPAAAAPTAASAGGAAGGAPMSMDELVTAAKGEGTLTTIALPHDWLNYGEMIDGFKTKYGLQVNELDPNAGSGDEVQAIKANKDNKGPQAPDVIDVGFSFGPSSKTDGLLQPYKVSTWDTIPNEVKDAEGYWYGDYYGVLSFAVNTDAVKNVPQDWADLLKPEYKSQVALAGDPRTSNQAILTVYAAALANGGSLDDAKPGLDFFAKLNEAGNLVPVIGKQATLVGETPILITWDYLALGYRDQLKDNPKVEVVVPKTGVLAGVYVQAISAFAPHPNAAKLWMEYLYSDEGQLVWLKGYGHPIRYNDLAKNNKIPADLASKLPAAELYAKAAFPSVEQQNAAKKTITEGWDSTVKVNYPK
jgi:putative spermidine/putrescine transport system substrate-binding protein